MTRKQLRIGLYDLFKDLYNEDAFTRRKRQYKELIRDLRRQREQRAGRHDSTTGANHVL